MKLIDQVRDVFRKKHYSIRTEQAYVQWIRRFDLGDVVEFVYLLIALLIPESCMKIDEKNERPSSDNLRI